MIYRFDSNALQTKAGTAPYKHYCTVSLLNTKGWGVLETN